MIKKYNSRKFLGFLLTYCVIGVIKLSGWPATVAILGTYLIYIGGNILKEAIEILKLKYSSGGK